MMTDCPGCDHLPAVWCQLCLERRCPNCYFAHHPVCAQRYLVFGPKRAAREPQNAEISHKTA